ncbi:MULTISPECIES: RNA-binding S4 domain-containing protein [unclassified Saccharibacter]|uniref:RNA-binding S4 domain-containing protein n=1 Tax=unclassified Saccharibacter TaxID=2648722 RepID=UPI001322B430|nr:MULTISPECIES: S4 domain-containing protein [unclassified Saccharibacter]MXV36227.1 RNA-binding S4 domain-containing protein [Saccharibacter sp. EH611]MXV57087.1 RNA-binding S4 domain-containing protein [Saccharibacter sp. EH70]MXV66553.1 RNA-binding S4 domain-containing protein [Saccharibacter sp. EH60]
MTEQDHQRLDMWLYYTRLAKTRALCGQFIRKGRVRINGQRTTKAHAKIHLDDVLTFVSPHHPNDVCVWQVKKLGSRRGPASEATQLYETIPS